MALGAQLPVRLDPEVERRLQSAAERLGTTKSALIRLLAKTFVDQVVKPDGSVSLPPNWANLLPAADGRGKRSSARDSSRKVDEGVRKMMAIAEEEAREGEPEDDDGLSSKIRAGVEAIEALDDTETQDDSRSRGKSRSAGGPGAAASSSSSRGKRPSSASSPQPSGARPASRKRR